MDLTRAATAGVSIYDVCDSDSSGWEAVYSILLQPGQDFAELKEELNFDEPIFDLLFLYCSVFHPSMERWRLFILDHAARLFGESSAMVMWENETGIASSDLARLGFRRIAGTELLFRPNMVVNDYSQDSLEQDGRDADLFEVDGQIGTSRVGMESTDGTASRVKPSSALLRCEGEPCGLADGLITHGTNRDPGGRGKNLSSPLSESLAPSASNTSH